MKFGVCCGLENAELVKKLGYDYFEMNFTAWTNQSEEEFRAAQKQIDALGFSPEAMNCMVPKTFRLTGEQVELSPVKAYLQKGYARAAAVGTKTVVFGSGGARRLPAGFTDIAKAYEQLVAFLQLASDCAAPYGICIAIEPLAMPFCNVVNFVSQAAYLAARADRPNVRILADYFHIAVNKESTEAISGFAHRMEHCHICNPATRLPMREDDGWDYTPFFSELVKAKYTKRVSIEPQTAVDWPQSEASFASALRLMKSETSQT